MAKICDATFTDFRNLQDKISKLVNGVASFEDAAQTYTAALYEAFKESIVLVRLFVTVPYEKLPIPNRKFVDHLALSKKDRQLIHDNTLVLSLVGTSGVKPEWNDRHQSQGHVGIPLVSADFIDAIPMMSRLLKQLGMDLNWIDTRDSRLVTRTIGSLCGVFFVPDAATEVDQKGRKIIAAQDFVATYHVKTVFGFGGEYLDTPTFFVTINFLRETLEKNQAERFATAMSFFKAITVRLVEGQIFA